MDLSQALFVPSIKPQLLVAKFIKNEMLDLKLIASTMKLSDFI